MFELTDTLTYAVPVMLSVLVAKTVADALEPKGIYDLVIELALKTYLIGRLLIQILQATAFALPQHEGRILLG